MCSRRNKRNKLIIFFALLIINLCGCGKEKSSKEEKLEKTGISTIEDYTGDFKSSVISDLEFNSLEDLKNAKVMGNLTGSICGDLIKAKYPDMPVKEFSTYSDMIIALKSKKIDAYTFDEPTVRCTVANNKELGVIDELLLKENYFFVFSKEKTALLHEFDNWVKDKKKTDYFERLKKYWVETDEKDIKPVDYKSLKGNKGKLKISIPNQSRPDVYVKNNDFTGYPLEVITDFARDAGYSLDLDLLDFSSCLVSVSTNKSDVLVSFVSKTEEREKQVLFSDSIYSGGLAFIVRKNNAEAQNKGFFTGLGNSFRRSFIEESRWKLISNGLLTTLIITLFGFLLANILGAIACYFAMSKRKTLKIISEIYSYIMQGTPMVVVLMVLYFIIFGNSNISGVVVAIIGFGLVIGAYLGQTFEGAVRGVDKGQWEASMAMGFTKPQTFLGIILPQMIRSMLPGYFSQLISLMKGTSIVGYIAVQDLTKSGDMIRSSTFEAFFPLIFVAVVYLIIACIILTILNVIKKRLDFNNCRARKQKIVRMGDAK